MNQKVVAAVLALILVGAGTVLLLFPQSSDSFHYETEFPEGGYTRVSLWLTDIQDCTLNVSFVDDPNVLYVLDLQLYDSASAASAFDLTVSDYGENSQLLQVRFEAKVRIKNLQLVLGTAVPYSINVPPGSSMNATFIYGNNVIGSDASLDYSATGSSVILTFTEDMVFSGTGMDIHVGAAGLADYVYLYADLVAGLSGLATFSEPLSLHSSSGWAFRSQFINSVTYGTDPLDPQPLLGFGVSAGYRVHAWLSD